MSQLTKAQKRQKNNIKAYAKGFIFLALACIEASREDDLQPYFKAAGVPKGNASNTSKKSWIDAKLSPAMPQLFNGEKWQGAILSTKRDAAFAFTEGADVAATLTNCKGLQNLEIEYGKSSGKKGALRSCYLFRSCSRLVPIVLQDNGAAGKVYKVDEETNKRAMKKETYKKYVSPRPVADGRELYTLEEIMQAFFDVLGVPAAIAEETKQRNLLKAAKTITAAEQAKALASNAAEKAKADAEKAKAKADAKADAAKQTQADAGMTAADAQKIVQADADRKAAADAEKAEAKSRKSGKQRKGSCKQTKKENARDLHSYDRKIK